MNLLLDTCTFLWLAEDDRRLSDNVRDLFQDSSNEIWLSPASAWEISLKHGLGKLQLSEDPYTYVPRMRRLHQIESLPITEEDSLQAGRLPLLHKDPFDRMLVGQALNRDCPILTPDPLIKLFPVRVVW